MRRAIIAAGALFAGVFVVRHLKPVSVVITTKDRDNGHLNGHQPLPEPALDMTAIELPRLRIVSRGLAQAYAGVTDIPAIEVPLGRFLDDIATVPGIEAIGLALWKTPHKAQTLSIYALTDLRQTGTPETPTADVIVADRYDELSEEVDLVSNDRLRTNLAFINTATAGPGEVARVFPTGLHDPILGEHALGQSLTRSDLTLAG